jgi:hypothetical protein
LAPGKFDLVMRVNEDSVVVEKDGVGVEFHERSPYTGVDWLSAATGSRRAATVVVQWFRGPVQVLAGGERVRRHRRLA